MAKTRMIFNPFTGNFEQVIEPASTGAIIGSILVATDEITGQTEILLDEDSVLYVDDEFGA
jgi:hypothetical protein